MRMIEAIIDALVAGLGEEGYEGEKFFQVDGKKYKQTGEEYRDFLIEATNDPSDPWDVMAIFCKVIESLPPRAIELLGERVQVAVSE